MDKRYTCYSDDQIKYRFERKPNTDYLQGFEISVESAGSTAKSIINDDVNDETNGITENGAKKYITDEDTTTTAYDTNTKISFAPRVLVDGVITTCDLSAPVTLETC